MSDPFDRQELLTRMYQEGYKAGRRSVRKEKRMSDLIDRQQAIDAIERNAYRHTYIDQIVGIIKELPSAEPVRMKGKWIGGELGCCSTCGHEGNASDIWNGCKGMFCPNCGADMRGEEDGN